MDQGPIKSLLDILPAYLNFVIGFVRSPTTAFAPYALTNRVHSDLTSFLLAGVGAAYLAGFLIPAPFDIQNPHGGMDRFAEWLSRYDMKLLPPLVLLVVLALALAGHLVAKFFDRWQGLSVNPDPPNLPGTAEDSVNAALGFAAVLLPLTTIVMLGTLALAAPALEKQTSQTFSIILFVGLFLYMAVAIFLYLPRSFAAVHKVSWGRASSALGVAFVCIAFVVGVIL